MRMFSPGANERVQPIGWTEPYNPSPLAMTRWSQDHGGSRPVPQSRLPGIFQRAGRRCAAIPPLPPVWVAALGRRASGPEAARLLRLSRGRRRRRLGHADQAGSRRETFAGRYQIVRQLGRGGMGVVYLAEDTRLDRQVALKLPMLWGDEDPEFLHRFYREARSAARLRHPSICRVYDVGEHDAQPYLTMEYPEGVLLSDYLKKLQPDGASGSNPAGAQLGEVMDAAHQQGIVHRDLKPANIMLDLKVGPIVMDFGLGATGGPRGVAGTRRPADGDAGLHAAGAVPGKARCDRAAERRVQPGGDPLRAAHRSSPLRGQRLRDPRQAAEGGAAGAGVDSYRTGPGTGRDLPPRTWRGRPGTALAR